MKALLALIALASFGFAYAAINVHVVPHTHDDVGWLKTVDEYYIGANNSIQHAAVQFVLDSVITQLQENSERKFIYVEIAFFERWWNQQTEEKKNIVRGLVASGQLEFINGGMCMNDEATTHYVDIVDQMALGHAFLQREFGVKPRIGWHIDPFGHSSVQAELFAEMGFDGFFFARIDYQDFNNRRPAKELEYIWRGSKSLGRSVDMFTGVLFNGYGPPDGFCFDVFCGDEPIQDDPALFDMNIERRAQEFVAQANRYNDMSRTGHVMMTMGSDFQYEQAGEWFKQLDKLLKYFKAHPELGVNMFYSTPSQYVDAIHALNLTWSVKTDDLFPYADGAHAYWTGYFVSRAALKGYVRWTSSYLQACRQVETLVLSNGTDASDLLSQAMGVAQHHDAVSGTEKQHVAYDYAKRLSIGQAACEATINQAVAAASQQAGLNVDPADVVQCRLINETICDATQQLKAGSSLFLAVYNPLASNRQDRVRLPVPTGQAANYVVTELASGSTVKSAVLAARPLRAQSAGYVLTFPVNVPAVGWSVYNIKATAKADEDVKSEPKADANTIENEFLRLTFGASGLVSVLQLDTQTLLTASHQMLYYRSSPGTPDDSQASGAYIFRPNETSARSVSDTPSVVIDNTQGYAQQAIVTFADWAVVTYRLYAGQQHVEVEYDIGPIPLDDSWGKEVVTRWTLPLATNKTWYTDSNGREMQTRIRDYRPSWPYQVIEPVAGNYVPINAAAYIRDTSNGQQLTVMTDRSQGGASIADGQLEIMLHRRLLFDDSRGVGDPLNEPGIDGKGLLVRTVHMVTFARADASATLQRSLMLLQQAPLIPIFSTSALADWSAVATPLPVNLHLETLQVAPNTAQPAVVVRLAHLFEVDESSEYSAPVTIDLSQLFNSTVIKFTDVTELSLSANQPLSDVHRLQWNTQQQQTAAPRTHPAARDVKRPAVRRGADGSMQVVINPMEIRTFLVNLA